MKRFNFGRVSNDLRRESELQTLLQLNMGNHHFQPDEDEVRVKERGGGDPAPLDKVYK